MVTLTKTEDIVPFKQKAKGKVRDLYFYPDDESKLLFVATDRISAYDVNMANGIPSKGALLTKISFFWFDYLTVQHKICRNHLSSAPLPEAITAVPALEGRVMVVDKYEIFPIEAIVRGYITGSAWKEYKKTGTIHGTQMPEGMKESEPLQQPVYTPSTKAEQGHDENIHKSQVIPILAAIYGQDDGAKYAARIEELALKLYSTARDYAITKGIIIADTKFEFGLDKKTNEVVLVDEVLTPDSSRFWKKSVYEVGRGQDSYDKQFLRDWLMSKGLNGKDGVAMDEEIVMKTREKYEEAYCLLTGNAWS